MESIIWTKVLELCVDVLTLLPWMVLATRARKFNMVGVKTVHGGEKISEYKHTNKEATCKLLNKLNGILHFVRERFWNVQNVSAGSLRDWKLRQLMRQQLTICNWF